MYPYLRDYESVCPYSPLIAIYNNRHMDVAVNMGKDGKQPGKKNVQIDGNIRLYGAIQHSIILPAPITPSPR